MSTSVPVGVVHAPLGLRERTRLAVQDQITDLACTLFTEQGFAVTTVEQIADAAGLSRRSFFRYFGSKEEVLLASFDRHAAPLASAFAARPGDEPLWLAVRRTLDVIVDEFDSDPAAGLRLMRLILSNAALAAGFAEKRRRWHDALVPDAMARVARSTSVTPTSTGALAAATSDGRRLAASAVVGAALASLTAAIEEWVAASASGTVADRVDRAFADLSFSLTPPTHPRSTTS